MADFELLKDEAQLLPLYSVKIFFCKYIFLHFFLLVPLAPALPYSQRYLFCFKFELRLLFHITFFKGFQNDEVISSEELFAKQRFSSD